MSDNVTRVNETAEVIKRMREREESPMSDNATMSENSNNEVIRQQRV